MATNNFTTILGKGGFGTVYKGILRNGVVVAVKVLSDASKQGAEEFLNEVLAKKILNFPQLFMKLIYNFNVLGQCYLLL